MCVCVCVCVCVCARASIHVTIDTQQCTLLLYGCMNTVGEEVLEACIVLVVR